MASGVVFENFTAVHAAAAIAAVIFFVQRLVPIILPLILVGVLRDDNDAVTWSVVGRLLHSSTWPALVRSDSSTFRGVGLPAKLMEIMSPIMGLLILLAGIVTPLGLSDVIVQSSAKVTENFLYIADDSPMGRGTPSRPLGSFNRICSDLISVLQCPGTNNVVTRTRTRDGFNINVPDVYDVRVPKSITDAFSSGLAKMDRSISSIFDIQWRSWRTQTDDFADLKGTRIVGAYRNLQSVLLNDRFEPVEGLVVDTRNGSIGFRSHSVPPPSETGTEWSEDLLFMQPVTECVDTNITIEFQIPVGRGLGGIEDFTIVDNGGFSRLSPEEPLLRRNDRQADLNLAGRAYYAAWHSNFNTMVYMNLTTPNPNKFRYLKSREGDRFDLTPADFVDQRFSPNFDSLRTSMELGLHLNFERDFLDENAEDRPLQRGQFRNPFGISERDFLDIRNTCAGAADNALANITNVAMICGTVYGAARRTDGGPSLIFEDGSRWSVPMYTCASAVKTTIKEVSFQFSGLSSSNFSALRVLDIQDETYDEEDDKPLWGVENLSMGHDEASPLWGLISEEAANQPNMSSIRREHLWLPGFVNREGAVGSFGTDNLPGVEFFRNGLSVAYAVAENGIRRETIDYSGKSNLALFSKWQELSAQGAESTAQILNLIWTDFATNAVVGTRGWMPVEPLVENATPTAQKRAIPDDDAANRDRETASVPVRRLVKMATYDFRYGVPAMLLLFVMVLNAIGATVMAVIGMTSPAKVLHYLDKTSAGRLMTMLVFPDECPPDAPKGEWLRLVGRRQIDFDATNPLGKGGSLTSLGPIVNGNGKGRISTTVTAGAAGAYGKYGYNSYL